MQVKATKKFILPNLSGDDWVPPYFKWFPAGVYPLEQQGDYFVIVDSSYGYSLQKWREVNGYGGLTVEF